MHWALVHETLKRAAFKCMVHCVAPSCSFLSMKKTIDGSTNSTTVSIQSVEFDVANADSYRMHILTKYTLLSTRKIRMCDRYI